MAGLGSLFEGFVQGATAGNKLAGAKDDREYRQLRNRVARQKATDAEDPEMQKLNKDILRGRAVRLNRGVDPMLSKSRALDVELKNEQLKALRTPPVAPAGPADTVPRSGLGAPPSAVGPQSDAGPEMGDDAEASSFDTAEADPEAPEMGVDPDADTTQFAAKGGMIEARKAQKPKAVKRYAEGGAVDDAPVEEPDAPDEGDDNEADNYDYQDSRDEHQAYSPQAGHDAALEGITHAAQVTGHQSRAEGVATDFSAARRARGSAAYHSGAGAATTDEMAAVRKAVDPDNKMSESERNFASLAHVYSYYLDKNEPAKAKQAAASMVQHYRMASDRYAAIAKVAAEHGDVNGALKNIMRAHANVPDGMDLKLTEEEGKIGYTFKDAQSGKVMQRGIAPPDEILKWATNGGIGSFDSLVAAAGGQRLAAKGKGAGEGGAKLTDMKEAKAQIDSGWDDVVGTMKTKDGKDAEIDPAAALTTKSDAFHIFMSPENRKANVTAQESAMVAGALAIPDPDNPNGKPFKVETVKGGRRVSLANGRSAFVPDAQFNTLITARGKAQQKLMKSPAKSDPGDESSTPGSGPSFLQGAVDAVGRGASNMPPQGKAPYGNPLTELGTTGRVSGRPYQPTPVPITSDIDRINAARRSAGQPPITEDQLSQVR